MNVVVYTTPMCSFCHQAKEFLSRQSVSFIEKNVAVDRAAAVEMVRLSGQQGVPVIVIDGQVVVGFDQSRLQGLLGKMRPRLGASVADAAAVARKQPGIRPNGAYVGEIRRGSPAERAGLRAGDVIVALGGQPVACATDLHRVVGEMPRGRDISLRFERDGQEKDTLVRL